MSVIDEGIISITILLLIWVWIVYTTYKKDD